MMQPGVAPQTLAQPTMDQQRGPVPTVQQQQQPWMMMPPHPQAQHLPSQMWPQQQQTPIPQMAAPQQQVPPQQMQPQPQQQQMPPPQQQPQQQQMPPQQQQPLQMQYPSVQMHYPQVTQPQYQTAMQPQYPPAQQQQTPTSSDEPRTLWIGDLQYWMDESYIHSCFAQTGEVVTVKIIRNKQTGQSEGYGFIDFVNRAAAERTLQAYSGALMPNAEQTFRLNWATLGSGDKRADDGVDYPIFVGDLASDVTDYMLQETFRSHYPSVKSARVVTDRTTGRSKGYGFVKFGDESEQLRAMTEMNGVFCSTRPMRTGPATTKKNAGSQQPTNAPYQSAQATQSENDPNNTTIFVGGLDPNVVEDTLRQVFSQFGELVHVKIPIGKRCGFVQFANRACAEEALLMLNGTQLGGQAIRLSWGRNTSNKQVQPQPDPNQWNGGYYGYGQGYETYGYGAAPAQDPNMYSYGAYPAAYQNYQQQQ